MVSPQSLQESFANLLNLCGGQPLPFFPVALGAELREINWADIWNDYREGRYDDVIKKTEGAIDCIEVKLVYNRK